MEELKQNMISSRYQAMRLANKEQLILYFKTGKMLSEKIDNDKWGAKVVNQISEDLQKQLPGLRGFSRRNLMKMKQFYADYQPILDVQPASTLLSSSDIDSIVPLTTAQSQPPIFESF